MEGRQLHKSGSVDYAKDVEIWVCNCYLSLLQLRLNDIGFILYIYYIV